MFLKKMGFVAVAKIETKDFYRPLRSPHPFCIKRLVAPRPPKKYHQTIRDLNKHLAMGLCTYYVIADRGGFSPKDYSIT